MALKIIQLKNKIDIAKRSLDELVSKDATFETRAAELENMVGDAETADEMKAVDDAIDAYENELSSHNERKANLAREISDLENELNALEIPVDENDVEPVDETRKENKMEIRDSKEYLHAWVETIKSGDDKYIRSILTENAAGSEGDTNIPVPTYVYNRVMTAWEQNEIFNRVRKTFFKGNFVVPVEVSSSYAVWHEEGTAAPEPEALVLDKVVLYPQTLKKWVPVSDEAIAIGMGGDERFIDYIYDELTYRIIAEFETAVIVKIGQAVSSGMVASETASSVPAGIYAALGKLSGRANNPVAIMSRKMWADAKAAALAANYAIDPFAGLEVIFNDFSNNSIIVGDLGYGFLANFPNGATVDVVADARPKDDMVDFVGRLLVGMGVVAYGAFCGVTITDTDDGGEGN